MAVGGDDDMPRDIAPSRVHAEIASAPVTSAAACHSPSSFVSASTKRASMSHSCRRITASATLRPNLRFASWMRSR